jgi:uncharacterized membrane protein
VQQIKTFHWWLSLAQLLVAAIVGSQGLLSPKAMQVFIVVNGFLGAAVHQLAAKWQPAAKSTEEEPK